MRTMARDVEKIVVACAIDVETRARLRQMAREQDVSLSTVLRDLLFTGLAVIEAQATTQSAPDTAQSARKGRKRAANTANTATAGAVA